jgi:hypothetical protein
MFFDVTLITTMLKLLGSEEEKSAEVIRNADFISKVAQQLLAEQLRCLRCWPRLP